MKRSIAPFLTFVLLIVGFVALAQNPPGGYGPQTGGSPGGSNGQVQFNNNGAFGGSSFVTISNTTVPLTVTGINGQSPTVSIAGPSSGQTVALSVSTTAGDGQPAITASGGSGPGIQSNSYTTATNCSSSASPAVCGSAAAGSFVLAAAATTVTVNTTAVTSNSQIIVINDDSLGTKLSVTCNTALDQVFVSARVAATSFTITGTAPVTNPNCYSYLIIN